MLLLLVERIRVTISLLLPALEQDFQKIKETEGCREGGREGISRRGRRRKRERDRKEERERGGERKEGGKREMQRGRKKRAEVLH